MSTTQKFQKKPDFFPSKDACVKAEREKKNTNPEYRSFKQTHFTAGDNRQFHAYRDMTNGQICIPKISMKNNVYKNAEMSDAINWEKYRDIGPISVTHTFDYIFNKFKKGIFIKVKDGQLSVFLPFSKHNFRNEWSELIQIDPKYGDIYGFIRHIQTSENRRFFRNNINKFTNSWYANNCLLRYEFPINEGDSNVPNMSDMFRTLCKERELPDMEFFVNRRDFPIIKTDNTEPYSHIYNSAKQPLLSHNYEKYAPILSMVGHKNFADIPIPTGDDWARVSRQEGKFFSRTCNRDFEVKNVPWEDRKSVAVFRGGSTGCGVTIKTNIRLKAAYISSKKPTDDDGSLLLDAGITNWNLRPRKLKNEQYLQTIDIKNLPFSLVPRLTPQEQAEYKYILHLDGHVSAFRLGAELSSGGCILLPSSKYKLWYRDFLVPYKHYVPVKGDLSDLIKKIKWCKRHDEKCKKIAKRAKKFAEKYITKKGILDYLQKLLYTLKQKNGIYLYNNITLQQLQEKYEKDIISVTPYYPNTKKTVENFSTFPVQERGYGLLQGMEWAINMLMDNGKLETLSKEEQKYEGVESVTILYKLGGKIYLRKSGKFIHAAFVAMKATNKLLKYIPNFQYVYGLCKNGDILQEDFGNNSTILRSYLHNAVQGYPFRFTDFLVILSQIALALHIAQKQYGFVHHDATPYNIILQLYPEPVIFDYIIDSETVYRVNSDIIPVLIPSSKTHIIYDNVHHGTVDMFSVSTIQDIFTLLVTSCDLLVTERALEVKNKAMLLTLANFLTGTEFHRESFRESGYDGLGSLRYFLKQTDFNTVKLGDLEEKTPLDLVKYIQKNFQMSNSDISVKKQDFVEYTMNKGNARQVFDYTFSSTVKDKVKSYTEVFRHSRKCDLSSIDNVFMLYYGLQNIEENLESVYEYLLSYLNKEEIESKKYTKKYQNSMNKLYTKYSGLDDLPLTPITFDVENIPEIKYNNDTFLFPKKIYALLKDVKSIQKFPTLPEYCNIIENVLLKRGNFSIPKKIRKYYRENFSEFLSNIFSKTLRVVNASTLIFVSEKLYALNTEKLLEKLQSEKGDCTTAKKYLAMYEKILATKLP